MGLTNRYIVLYFHKGAMPSKEQLVEAQHFGPNIMFRNANFHTPGETGMEPCTAVAGEVPRDYRAKYPAAVSYIDWLQGKLPAPPEAPKPRRAEPAPDIGFKVASRGAPIARMPAPPPPPGADPGFEAGLTPPNTEGAPASPGGAPPPPADWQKQAG